MLTCLYHPLDDMIVVEEEDAQKYRDMGVWFDHPLLAKDYRKKLEKELKEERSRAVKKLKKKE